MRHIKIKFPEQEAFILKIDPSKGSSQQLMFEDHNPPLEIFVIEGHVQYIAYLADNSIIQLYNRNERVLT